MAFRYHFGGVEIASEIPLTGLRPGRADGSRSPVIHVLEGRGEPPGEDRLHYAWDGRFRLRLGETGGLWRLGCPWGAFVFDREASECRIFRQSPADGTILEDLFARRLLPRLVKLKGGWAYHAASLAQGDSGVLLMGHSGAGKSTMSVGLAMSGHWDLLGDDMALIWTEHSDRLAPAANGVAIWPQSSAGLQLAEEDCAPLSGYDGKLVFHPPRTERVDPVALAGIFFLQRTGCDAPSVVRRSRADAFAIALEQVIHFNPSGEAPQERVGSVVHLNTMLGRVPAWTLTYPATFGAMNAVSDVISEALRDC